jgi:hypothetical protein
VSDVELYLSMLRTLPSERVASLAAWLICLAAQHYGAARNVAEPGAALIAINCSEQLFMDVVNRAEAEARAAGWSA